MNRAPADRSLSVAALSLASVTFAMCAAAGGSCSLNTSGITDPRPPASGGNGGDVTGVHTGTGLCEI